MPSKEPRVSNLYPEEEPRTSNLYPEEEPRISDLFGEEERQLERAQDSLPYDAGIPLMIEAREDAGNLGQDIISLLSGAYTNAPQITTEGLNVIFGGGIIPGRGLSTEEKAFMANGLIAPTFGFLMDAEEKPRRAAVEAIKYLQETGLGKAQRTSLRFLFGGGGLGVSQALEEQPKTKFSWSELEDAMSKGWSGEVQTKVGVLRRRAVLTDNEIEARNTFLDKYPKLKAAATFGEFSEDLAFSLLTEAFMWDAAKKGAKIGDLFDYDKIRPKQFVSGFDSIVKTRMEEIMQDPELLALVMSGADIPNRPELVDSLFDQIKDRVDVEVFNNFKVSSADEAVKAIIHHELLQKVTKITKPGGSQLVKRKQLDNIIDAISNGRTKKIEQLDKYELEAAYKDIQALIAAPEAWKPNFFGRKVGGVPTWKVFETMGVPRAYDIVDNAIYQINLNKFSRIEWQNQAIKGYEKKFGRKFNEVANEVAARMADIGPDKWYQLQHQDWLDKMDLDEIWYLRDMVTYDKANYWDPIADVAEELGFIGGKSGVARQEWYFHHRTRFIDLMNKRMDDAVKRGEKVVLPSEYYLERILGKKIPANVSIPEFFARHANEENIPYNWREITDIAYKEELNKVYLEPSLKEMEALVTATDNGDIIQYSADWARYVRGHPTRLDEIANQGIEFITGKAKRFGIKPIERNQRAYEKLTKEFRKVITTGTMAFNTRSIAKNFLQSNLTINTIGSKATMAGIESAWSAGGRRMLGKYHATLGRGKHILPLSEIDITTAQGFSNLTSKLTTTGLKGFSAVDLYMNVAGAGNGAMFKLITSDPKRMAELVEYAAKKGVSSKATKGMKFWDVLADAVDDGHFEDLVNLANRNIKMTQWSYLPHDYPRHLWGATGKTVWQFTSWPSNYFSVHLPQLIKQMTTGTGVFGDKVPYAQRLALINFVARTSAMIYIGGKLGYNLRHLGITGPLPTGRLGGYFKTPFPVSPGTELVYSFGEAIVGSMTMEGDRLEAAWKGFANAAPTAIPFGTMGKHLYRVFGSGEEEIPALFFPPAKAPKPGALKTLKGLKGLEFKLP